MRRTAVVSACTILLLASTCVAQQASAAVPNLIRYSGSLKDAQGAALASSAAGVTFAIYKQQEGGAAVWIETQNVTTDPNGNYSVLLGSTTATGLPSDLFSEQEPRWLGVQVQGQAEQPRVLMASVPYALRAGEAERLAGHSISDFVTTGNLQTAVQQQLQQQGSTASGSNSAGKTVQNSGTHNPSRPTDPATNFVDSTNDQVVGVTQNGTGKGISVVAAMNNAVVGTSTATTGSAAGILATSSAPNGYGIIATETATGGTGNSYGIYGAAASTSGVGLSGVASATTGLTTGVVAASYSSSGVGLKAVAQATSGNTYGLQATVNSPTGTVGLFQNVSSIR